MNLTVQLKGVDAVSLRTKALISAARSGLKFGADEAGFILAEEEREQVPVESGYARDHIHTEVVEDTTNKYAVAVVPVYEDSSKYGLDPAYIWRLNYGFMGTDSLGRHYNQAPNGYIRRTWDTKQGDAREAIVNGIYESLDAVKR
jgi:hypothetical protein